jgi:hypothetical protein
VLRPNNLNKCKHVLTLLKYIKINGCWMKNSKLKMPAFVLTILLIKVKVAGGLES